MNALLARPLALAGPCAVAGVLLARLLVHGPLGCTWALLALPLLGRLLRPAPLRRLVLAAVLAGLVAGARLELKTHRALARGVEARPRAPPLLGRMELRVDRCGEDPLAGRAWIEGAGAQGTGLHARWAGSLPPGVVEGAFVRVTGRFFAPSAPRNPGERDRRLRWAERGVSLLADLRTPANVEIVEPARPGPRAWLRRIRIAAACRLRRSLPADVAPLAAALLLGYRSRLRQADRLVFERTGTLHLLAISGLHVVLLAGLVHALLRRCGAGPRSAAAATMALALAYVPIAGAGPPIRRAVSVIVGGALALLRGRRPDAASTLGGAALLLALSDPAEVWRLGFRLSFAAASGIALLAAPWRERWSRRHRLLARFPAVRRDRFVRLRLAGYVLDALPVALAAWLATQGLVAHAFGVVTPLAPFSNLLVGPLVALLLPAVALCAAGVAPAAGAVAALVTGLRGVLGYAAAVPYGFLTVPAPALGVALIWTGSVAALRWAPRRGAVLLAALALAVAAGWRGIFPSDAAHGPRRGAWSAAASVPAAFLLDVGAGQALLIRGADRSAVLVDGGSRSRTSLGSRLLRPALVALGVARLRAVVCTHADADHWSGLPYLLEIFPVDRLWTCAEPAARLRRAANRRGVELIRARTGDEIWRDRSSRTRLRVLHDGGPASQRATMSRNDRSLVLLLEARGCRLLLPGDREEAGLASLLEGAGPSRCALLVAPHHGGRCAAPVAARLGRSVSPDVLLVSAARGRPDRCTLQAYGARETVSTWSAGCVAVRFTGGGGWIVETFATPRRLHGPPGGNAPRATIRRH